MGRASITLMLTLLDDAYYLPEWVECARCIAADEVLIVDGGSTDGGPEFLARRRLRNFRLLRHPMEETDWHYSEQLNFGAWHAQGDWILLLDADEILWPPERRLLDRAIRRAGRGVISLWFARFDLWPDEQSRVNRGDFLDPQPRLWKHRAGICWVRKTHNQQWRRGKIIEHEHRTAELLETPVILHRKLTAPRRLQLARHRRWLEHWADASAEAGLPIPREMPKDHGPTLPLPRDVARWREDLMRTRRTPPRERKS